MGELVLVSWPILQTCPSITHMCIPHGGFSRSQTWEKCLQPSYCGDSLLRSPTYLVLSALSRQPSHYNLASHVDFPTGREQADLWGWGRGLWSHWQLLCVEINQSALAWELDWHVCSPESKKIFLHLKKSYVCVLVKAFWVAIRWNSLSLAPTQCKDLL